MQTPSAEHLHSRPSDQWPRIDRLQHSCVLRGLPALQEEDSRSSTVKKIRSRFSSEIMRQGLHRERHTVRLQSRARRQPRVSSTSKRTCSMWHTHPLLQEGQAIYRVKKEDTGREQQQSCTQSGYFVCDLQLSGADLGWPCKSTGLRLQG